MKVGIVCDNYKLDKFLEEIKSRNLVETHQPFITGVTAIYIYTTRQIASDICVKCEQYFKDLKAKNN